MDIKNIALIISAIASIFLAVIAATTTWINVSNYLNQLRLERASNANKFHERWWSNEYSAARQNVDELVKCLENKGKKDDSIQNFLNCFPEPKIEHLKPEKQKELKIYRRNFVKLVFFFADLNVYIDEKLISIELADRLFGKAQYEWFKDLIFEVREKIKDELRLEREVRSIPEELIRIKANKIWKKRKSEEKNGTPDGDWREARQYMKEHWWEVLWWKFRRRILWWKFRRRTDEREIRWVDETEKLEKKFERFRKFGWLAKTIFKVEIILFGFIGAFIGVSLHTLITTKTLSSITDTLILSAPAVIGTIIMIFIFQLVTRI